MTAMFIGLGVRDEPTDSAKVARSQDAMTTCDTCAVREHAICGALLSSELQVLSAIGRRRVLKAGESLSWEGDDSLTVGNVIRGVLKLSTSTSDGREQIVGVAYPSDFIGRPFGGTSGHAITALTDALVCVFARRDFDEFVSSHPLLENKLLRHTLAELDRTRHWMLLLGRKTAEERVATFLLDMSQRLPSSGDAEKTDAKNTGADQFELPFSRQQVADLLGLTIETVSRQFTKLKRERWVDLPSRRTVIIKDRRSLEAMAS